MLHLFLLRYRMPQNLASIHNIFQDECDIARAMKWIEKIECSIYEKYICRANKALNGA